MRLTLLLLCAATLGAQTPKPNLGSAPRVSPDGATILFTSDRSGTTQLYSMNASGAAVRQLTTDSAGAHSANWSPDGRRIVFVNGSAIIAMNADGTNRRVLSDTKGNQTPSWSPDGQRIVFAAGEFPNIAIHPMNADGTDRRRLPGGEGLAYDPAWSPDGKTIAYVTGTAGTGPRIYLMNADGSNRRRLTQLTVAEERPSWSTDGKKLAFQASERTNGVSDANIYVSDIRNGETKRITTHRGPRLDETPSWFPDGQRLAIQSDRDGTWSIYVIDLAGATKTRLVSPANYYNPEWSPNSRTIAFESTRDGGYAVFSVNVDGSDLRKLSVAGDGGQPSWSPDGKRIVFSASRGQRGNLYVMNADGSDETRLTDFAPGGGKYGAHFSPDGRWIVFQGRSNNALVNENVYIVRSDGTGMRRLTDTTLNSFSPRWTKDGNIQFMQNRYSVLLWSQMTEETMRVGNAQSQLVTMRPDGVELSRVARPGSGESATDDETSPDGRFIVTAKNEGESWGIYVKNVATGAVRAVVGGNAQPARIKP